MPCPAPMCRHELPLSLPLSSTQSQVSAPGRCATNSSTPQPALLSRRGVATPRSPFFSCTSSSPIIGTAPSSSPIRTTGRHSSPRSTVTTEPVSPRTMPSDRSRSAVENTYRPTFLSTSARSRPSFHSGNSRRSHSDIKNSHKQTVVNRQLPSLQPLMGPPGKSSGSRQEVEGKSSGSRAAHSAAMDRQYCAEGNRRRTPMVQDSGAQSVLLEVAQDAEVHRLGASVVEAGQVAEQLVRLRQVQEAAHVPLFLERLPDLPVPVGCLRMPLVLERERRVLRIAGDRHDRIVVFRVTEAGQFVQANDLKFRLPSPQFPGAHELQVNLIQVERM